jgi:hypothetical protein
MIRAFSNLVCSSPESTMNGLSFSIRALLKVLKMFLAVLCRIAKVVLGQGTSMSVRKNKSYLCLRAALSSTGSQKL